MTRDEIIERARSYCGAKVVFRGRSGRSIDCLGLVVLVAGLEGTEFDRIDYLPERVQGGDLREGLVRAGFEPLEVGAAEPGDLLTFFWWQKRDGIERHCGILTGDGRMVHATDATGIVQEVQHRGRWESLTVGAYRFPGVEEAA